CMPPGPHGELTMGFPHSGATPNANARVEFSASGALVSIDGTACTFAADQTPPATGPHGSCFDRYDCGPCTIEVSVLDMLQLDGRCPPYDATYTICNLTQSCDGAVCGSDSCGVVCSATPCPSGMVCNSGHCMTPPDPCAMCLDACSGLPGCCTGTGCICDS